MICWTQQVFRHFNSQELSNLQLVAQQRALLSVNNTQVLREWCLIWEGQLMRSSRVMLGITKIALEAIQIVQLQFPNIITVTSAHREQGSLRVA